MKKLTNIFTIFLLFLFIYILFKYNYILINSVLTGVDLWLKKVFPMLFIMNILNDIIINSNILKPLNNLIKPIFNKIFKVKGNSSICFLLSIFSGTPSASFIIKEMLNTKQISLKDANKLISFTFFMNPLFLYNILKIEFNIFTTIKIILIHYIANIFIGIIFKSSNSNEIIYQNEFKKKNILTILPNSIKKSLDTQIMILGTIVFYMIISNLIIKVISLNEILMVILNGLLEVTNGLNSLALIELNIHLKEILSLIIISFGGFSIHTQVMMILNDTNINYKYFLLGRCYHVIISIILYLIINIFLFL